MTGRAEDPVLDLQWCAENAHRILERDSQGSRLVHSPSENDRQDQQE